MDHEPEILVHISASATRQKENLYRSVADAYRDFEPAGSPQGTSHVTISNDDYGSFPSQMGSVNHSSGHAQTGVQVPSSFYEESQPSTSRLDRLERIQAQWRQTAFRPSSSNALRSSGIAPLSSAFPEDAIIDDTQLAFQALESQISDYMSATSEEDAGDVSVIESTGTRVPLVEAAGNAQMFRPVIPQKAPISPQEPAPTPTALSVVATADVNHPEAARQALTDHQQPACHHDHSQDLASLPLDVYPPAPPVTVLSPEKLPSQVTSFLATLEKENPNRFRPRRKSRALDDDERGCWLVDSNLWPHAVRYPFWTSLADHVASGRLGWGVTLHRHAAKPHELGLLRLYCWGEIVEHTWLALWLCSDGKISAYGSKWVDAEEKVVVEVTGYYMLRGGS
jgi:hypothetical protein